MRVEVVGKDATTLAVDVLALKYAQARYGLDERVYQRLIDAGHDGTQMSPAPGSFRLVRGARGVSASNVLFVGTKPLSALQYLDLRILARDIMAAVSQALPQARTVALTVHGPNYGLDEPSPLSR